MDLPPELFPRQNTRKTEQDKPYAQTEADTGWEKKARKFCPSCGAEIDEEDAVRCWFCGNRLSWTPSLPDPPKPVEGPKPAASPKPAPTQPSYRHVPAVAKTVPNRKPVERAKPAAVQKPVSAWSGTPAATMKKTVPKGRTSGKRVINWLIIAFLVVIIISCSTSGKSGRSTKNTGLPTSAPTGTALPSLISAPPELSYRFEWKEISSSLATKIGYDSRHEVLAVTFRDSGITYYYYDVPESVWKGISTADSVGSYFNQYIKDSYDYKKAG